MKTIANTLLLNDLFISVPSSTGCCFYVLLYSTHLHSAKHEWESDLCRKKTLATTDDDKIKASKCRSRIHFFTATYLIDV